MLAAFDGGIPVVLKLIEVMGIQRARAWKTASLNEFRQFFKLVKHERFEDITPDPELQLKLRQLYDHPDFVELYPGLIIEGTKKPMVPGSGLCPPQTIGMAILSDAVSVVRGDRFYTTVLPFSLTISLTIGLLPRPSHSFRDVPHHARSRHRSRWRYVQTPHASLSWMVPIQYGLRNVPLYHSRRK